MEPTTNYISIYQTNYRCTFIKLKSMVKVTKGKLPQYFIPISFEMDRQLQTFQGLFRESWIANAEGWMHARMGWKEWRQVTMGVITVATFAFLDQPVALCCWCLHHIGKPQKNLWKNGLFEVGTQTSQTASERVLVLDHRLIEKAWSKQAASAIIDAFGQDRLLRFRYVHRSYREFYYYQKRTLSLSFLTLSLSFLTYKKCRYKL